MGSLDVYSIRTSHVLSLLILWELLSLLSTGIDHCYEDIKCNTYISLLLSDLIILLGCHMILPLSLKSSNFSRICLVFDSSIIPGTSYVLFFPPEQEKLGLLFISFLPPTPSFH